MVYIAPIDDIDMERTILHLKIIKLNKTIEELQQETFDVIFNSLKHDLKD